MNDALNAPTTDSDVPNAIPDAGPQMSTSGQPVAPVQADPQQAPPQQAAQPPVQVVAAHPRASLFHSIMETLGGGDKTQVVIDPQTGTMSTVRTPQTSGGLAKGILAGALTGLLTGASQSSGEGTRAFGQGAQAAMQQRQQAQQQQEQKTKEDFDRQQQTKVRQAQIMKANMEAMRTAYAIGQENDEAKDKFIANHADDLANWKNLGVIQDSGVPSDQLMTKGYDSSKYAAIPDGRVPKINPDGSRATADGIPLSQLTYSVVDATGQAPLTQDKYNKMVQYGLQRPNGTSSQIPEGATISSAVLAQMNHKMDAIDQTQAELDKVAGPGKINLLEQIKKNPGLVDAIDKYHNDNSSTEPDVQINNMQNKFPQQAGLLRSAFGEDNLQKYKENREARGKAEATKQEAKARQEVKEGSAEGQQEAQNRRLTAIEKGLQIKKLQKETEGVDLSKISTSADGLEGVKFNPGDPNYRINENILGQIKQQDPGLEATVRAIGEGRELMTPQAQRTKDGQEILKAVNLAYPDYNAAKVESYHKGRQIGTSGSLGNKVNSFATAMDHLQRYYDNINNISATAGVGSIAAVLGNESAKALQTDRTALASEIANAYKGGVPSKEEIDKWEKSLSGGTAAAAKNGAVETAKLLHGKFSEYSNQYRNMIPGGLHDDQFQLMSNTAANAYQHVTGQPIGNTQPFSQGQQQPQQQPVFARNPQTDARVMSNDGGKTWQPAQ